MGDDTVPSTSLRDALRADRAAFARHAGATWPRLVSQVAAVLVYRLSSASYRRWRPFGYALAALNTALTGADIDPGAQLGAGLMIYHAAGVVIGPGVRTGRNTRLFGSTVLGLAGLRGEWGYPTLGDDVTLYAKATVVGPVRVGAGAVIGPHALVMRDVGDTEVVYGPRS